MICRVRLHGTSDAGADDIQCDEARPTCSGCADRRVQCQYSNEVSKFIHLHQTSSEDSGDGDTSFAKSSQEQSKQIVLSIRSCREPPSGTGRYHTFVPSKTNAKGKARQARKDAGPKPVSISPPPCNDITRLQNEFGAVLHSSSSPGMNMRLWGRWMELAMLRVGTSPLLDRSIACLVAGHKARYANDIKAMHVGRQRYGDALTLLRDTVAGGTNTVTSDVIAATKMLMNFEYVPQVLCQLPALHCVLASRRLFEDGGNGTFLMQRRNKIS